MDLRFTEPRLHIGMKVFNHISALGFIIGLVLISCEPVNNTDMKDSEFRILFSDSTEIVEDDILYYDSTAHFLYLKEDLYLDPSVLGFSVLVNHDTIYTGIIYSCHKSNPPPEPFLITDCFHYGPDILELDYYPLSSDLRNDPRIINALKEDDLLRNGIKCSIDSVKVKSFEDYSEAICHITVTNHDLADYYILDPGKMGDLDFTCYTGGIYFQNMDTKAPSTYRWSVSNPYYGEVTMNDFSLLSGDSKVSFTFKCSDYHKMGPGYYYATLKFCGLEYYLDQYDLVQDSGRIWVGRSIATIDSIRVE